MRYGLDSGITGHDGLQNRLVCRSAIHLVRSIGDSARFLYSVVRLARVHEDVRIYRNAPRVSTGSTVSHCVHETALSLNHWRGTSRLMNERV
jgi:hypothetical protein